VTEAILAGAVAGAIAGAITAAAIALISSRRAPQPGRWRSFTMRSTAPSSAFEPPHAGGRVTGPFDRFDDRAKRVLALAQDESIRMNHNYIGTEHLLLGLIREGEGVAARVLFSLGIDLTKVRKGVEYIVGRGEAATSPSEITLSPRTKKIIELAIDEARKLGTLHVGTEHLLLALVREGEGIAAGIIESLGVAGEQVRERVLATLQEPRPPSP
jgi:ClpA/ClpB-like protein